MSDDEEILKRLVVLIETLTNALDTVNKTVALLTQRVDKLEEKRKWVT